MRPFDEIVSLSQEHFAFRIELYRNAHIRKRNTRVTQMRLKPDNDIRYFLDRDASPRQTIRKL